MTNWGVKWISIENLFAMTMEICFKKLHAMSLYYRIWGRYKFLNILWSYLGKKWKSQFGTFVFLPFWCKCGRKLQIILHGGEQYLLPSLNHVESCESMLGNNVFMNNFGSKCTTTLSLWFLQLDMIKNSIWKFCPSPILMCFTPYFMLGIKKCLGFVFHHL